jgi:hypothetical protein
MKNELSDHAKYQLLNFHGTYSDMSYKLLEVLNEIDSDLVKKYDLFTAWAKIGKMQ